MSMSYSLTFHRKPTDSQWEKNMAAAKALYEAGITKLPPQLASYFGQDYVDPPEDLECALQVGAHLSVLYNTDGTPPPGVTPTRRHDSASGFEIDLDELPKDIRIIRVECGC